MASPSILPDCSPNVMSTSGPEPVVSPKQSPGGRPADPAAERRAQTLHPSPGESATSPHTSASQPGGSPHPSPGQTASPHPSPGPLAASPYAAASQPSPGRGSPGHAAGSPPAGRRKRRLRGARGRRWRRAGREARGAVSRDTLLAEGHPLAPSNTTDFIMDDHDDEPAEGDVLFDRYGQPTPRESPQAAGWGADANPGWAHLEPSVARLVAEHMQMESHIEVLEARIALVRQRRGSASDGSDEEMGQGEVRMAPETAAKIRVLETEIRRLEEENAQLREGNERLAARGCGGSVDSYTSDSESDSSSSSSASSGSTRSSSSSSDSDSDSSGSESESPPTSPKAPASV